MLLQQHFYHSFTQRHGLDTPGDVAIIQISILLIDDIPETDPRWAESQHQGDWSSIVNKENFVVVKYLL